MPKLTFIETDGTARTIDAETGLTVMENAIQNDVPGILATCGGSCSCATCHVYLTQEWFDKLGALSLEELDMLDTAHDLEPTSRLSCQIMVTDEMDGLTMRTPPRQI
jgi:2Fe-2S ferredoxin